MSGRVTCCCVVLLLTLTSVSSVQRLDSVNQLIEIDRSLYEQISEFLQWFANTADIDDNAISLTFDPEGGDYTSHHYGNYEDLLERRRYGFKYYTLGNIYRESPVELPSNVIHHNRNGRNTVRIIVRVREPNPGRQRQRIDRVYITQHCEGYYEDDGCYDPEHTYEISTRLLREMRANQGSHLSFRAQSTSYTPQSYSYRDHRHENQWSVLDVLRKITLFILVVFIIAVILANLPQPKSRWQ